MELSLTFNDYSDWETCFQCNSTYKYGQFEEGFVGEHEIYNFIKGHSG